MRRSLAGNSSTEGLPPVSAAGRLAAPGHPVDRDRALVRLRGAGDRPTPGRPSASGCSASRSSRSDGDEPARLRPRRCGGGTRSACRPCFWDCCGLGFLLQLVDCAFAALRPAAAAGAARQARADRRGRVDRSAATPSAPPDRPSDTPGGPRHDRPRPHPPHRLTRADLDALPSYVPGRSPADLARELGLPEAIKLASNEVPYGPLPGVVEAVAEAAAGRAPLPRHGRGRAARRARRAVRRRRRPDRHRLRLGRAGRAPGPGHLPARRRDRSTRGARSRRTRSSRRPPARPACGCRTPPGTGTTWRRWPARSPTGPG